MFSKKHTALFCSLIAGATFSIMAQQPSIEIRLEAEHLIFGQPVYATYRVTNPSDTPLYLGAKADASGKVDLFYWKARAYGPDGKQVPFREGSDCWIGNGPRRPKWKLVSGAEVLVSQPIPVTDTYITGLAPGQYLLRFTLPFSLTTEPDIFEKEVSTETRFFVDAAQGEDALYLQAMQEAIRKADPKSLRRSSRDSPLGWYEVLEGPVEGIIPSLLNRFPTSTYAGYVLWHTGPPMATWKLECLNDPEGSLRKECGSEGSQREEFCQRRMREIQDEQRAYAKPLSLFLEAHPDYPHAQDLRKRYAMCLGLTGRMSDAMVQILLLAKGTGREADEAKAFLEAKSASAGKKP